MTDKEWQETLRFAKNHGHFYQLTCAVRRFVYGYRHKDIKRFISANRKVTVLEWYKDYYRAYCD